MVGCALRAIVMSAGLVVASVTPAISAPSSVPVTVVNTPSVNVANSVAVTGSVSLAPGAQVTLPNHLGVRTANLITLWCFAQDGPNYPTCSSFRQIDSAGVLAATPFVIPAGETLVITDMDWEATLAAAGATVFLNLGCTSGCSFIYSSSTMADSQGIAAKSDHLTSGLYLTYVPSVTVGDAAHLSGLQLHGYLTQ